MVRNAMWALVLLSATGCLRSTTYKCDSNAQCTGTGGQCESTGFCSFSDPACGGGQRYGDYAGELSNKCVDESLPMPDGGVDGSSTVDAPPGGCPSTYMAITGQTHVYRVIANVASYMTQKAACASDGANAYLAVPGDQNELDALMSTANRPLVWVGIDDIAAEGQYVTANGGTLDSGSPLWETPEPNDTPRSGGGPADCVSASATTNMLGDDKCGNTYAAVCECEP